MKGETQVKPLRTLLTRVFVGALLLALTAGVANADTVVSADPAAGTAQLVLPEDPGLE